MTARDRLILYIAVAAAAVAAAWFAIIGPKSSDAAKLGDQVTAQKARISAADAQIAQGTANRRSYAANYATVARLGGAVPADDETPSLVYQLEAAARHAGVEFRNFTTSAGTSGSGAASATGTATVGSAGFPTLPFSLNFDGSYFRMADFFHELERFVVATDKRIAVGGRLMSLDSLQLGPSRHGFPKVGATLTATAYMLPASEGLTAGATPTSPASQTSGTGSGTTGAAATTPAPATTP